MIAPNYRLETNPGVGFIVSFSHIGSTHLGTDVENPRIFNDHQSLGQNYTLGKVLSLNSCLQV